jgi:outer membrane protein insertion porin family
VDGAGVSLPLNSPTDIPYGGTQELYDQFEIEYPLVTEAGIKGVIFYDIGTADDAIVLSALRQDFGFGFRWFSPIGPLRFEWGFPIARQANEGFSNFEFSIGSPF